MQNKLVYNVHELSEVLGLSIRKTYELTRSENFPRIRVGRRILVPKQSLENWLQDESKTNEFERGF